MKDFLNARCSHRRLAHIVMMALVCGGCARTGFDPFAQPCDTVDCGSAGRCESAEGVAHCLCDAGYQSTDLPRCELQATGQCASDSDCDDGNPCTEGDRCISGACVGGALSATCMPLENGFLLADINATTADSGSSQFVNIDGRTLFSGYSPDYGYELWETDGSPAGTRLFLDIQPGPLSGIAGPFLPFGSRKLFLADDGTTGKELWVTDGTVPGTHLLRDISAGNDPSNYTIPLHGGYWYGNMTSKNGAPVMLNGELYFTASSPGASARLWKTDGTEAGTTVVEPSSGDNYRHVKLWGATTTRVFFAGGTDATGTEVWSTDGSAAGTGMVMDLRPGTGSGTYSTMHVVTDSFVVFTGNAEDGFGNFHLWRTDGTIPGTFKLKAVELSAATEFKGSVYFSASSSAEGREPWVTDGTLAGTKLLADLNPGTPSSSPTFLSSEDGILYIYGVDGAGIASIWTHYGTAAAPSRLASLRDDNGFVNQHGALKIPNGTVYVRHSAAEGVELWSKNDLGERLLVDAHLGPEPGLNYGSQLIRFRNEVIFNPCSDTIGCEPWITDGTVVGTRPLIDVFPGARMSSRARSFSVANDRFYFYADDGVHGMEPWSSDGTAAGTVMLADFNPNPSGSQIWEIFATSDFLYFAANDGRHGEEFWKSDGTPAGTVLADDLAPGTDGARYWELTQLGDTVIMIGEPGSVTGLYAYTEAGGIVLLMEAVGTQFIGSFFEFQGWMYFIGSMNDLGIELWRTDGTPSGTELAKDVNPGTGYGFDYDGEFASGGNYMVFNTYQGDWEPWVSDGTDVGTMLLRNINEAAGSNPTDFLGVGSQVFFQADDGSTGEELWVTDGTAVGTVLVKDIIVGGVGSHASPLADTNGLLLFAVDATVQEELWISDGSEAGTAALGPLALPNRCDTCLVNSGGWTYVSGDDGGGLGRELWRTDGLTLEIVVDLYAGADGGSPYGLTLIDGWVYFAADDGVHGYELWRTLGTSETTELVADIRAGPESSYPGLITSFAGKIYVTADDGKSGDEIWVIEP